jgi:hypothetical protein
MFSLPDATKLQLYYVLNDPRVLAARRDSCGATFHTLLALVGEVEKYVSLARKYIS